MAQAFTFTRSDPLIESLQFLGQNLRGAASDITASREQALKMELARQKGAQEESLAGLQLEKERQSGQTALLLQQGKLTLLAGQEHRAYEQLGFLRQEAARKQELFPLERQRYQVQTNAFQAQIDAAGAALRASNLDAQLKQIQLTSATEYAKWERGLVPAEAFAQGITQTQGPDAGQLWTQLVGTQEKISRGQAVRLMRQVKDLEGPDAQEQVRRNLLADSAKLSQVPEGSPERMALTEQINNGMRLLAGFAGKYPGRNIATSLSDFPAAQLKDYQSVFESQVAADAVLMPGAGMADWMRDEGIMARTEGQDPKNTWARTVFPTLAPPTAEEMGAFKKQFGRDPKDAREVQLKLILPQRVDDLSRRHGTIATWAQQLQAGTRPAPSPTAAPIAPAQPLVSPEARQSFYGGMTDAQIQDAETVLRSADVATTAENFRTYAGLKRRGLDDASIQRILRGYMTEEQATMPPPPPIRPRAPLSTLRPPPQQ